MQEVSGYLCSFPKSGRTWMRFALANYLVDRLDLPLEVDLQSMFSLLPNMDQVIPFPRKDRSVYAFDDRPDVPLIMSSHLRFDEQLYPRAPIVLLLRDPRDVMVSQHLHKTRQDFTWEGERKEFLRDPEVGIADLIAYLNSWAPHAHPPRTLVLSYERLRADPATGFGHLLDQFGIRVDVAAVDAALDAASVDRMRAVEMQAGISGHHHDRSDPEALRVRKAKVGGFGDYLDDDDLAYLAEACARELTPEAKDLLARFDLAFF